MRRNRLTWGIVSLVVLTTIAITIGTRDSHTQQKAESTPTQQNKSGVKDLNKYAVVDYNAPEPANAREREERRIKNKRYDGQEWIMPNPHPNDSGVGRYDEIPPLPPIPLDESDLIIVGKTINASAFISNDKRGIYTEFIVSVEEVLRNGTNDKIVQNGSIAADRQGGYIRFPNGQKVFYENSNHDLPWTGREYLLFLAKKDRSTNYQIIVGYELNTSGPIPLDTGLDFDEFKSMSKKDFVESVRTRISKMPLPKQ